MLISLCYFQRLLSLPLLFIYSLVNGKSSIPHFSFVPYFICSCCSLFISCSCRAMPPFIFVLFNLSLPCILTYSVPSVRRCCHGEMGCFVIPAFFSVTKQNQFILPPLFSSVAPSIPNLPRCFWLFFLLSLSRPSSSSETPGELLLKSTDRGTAEKETGQKTDFPY